MNSLLKIQLQPNSKKAFQSGWTDFSREKLQALDTLTDTSKNYGVITGKVNNIVVFDYDIHKLSSDRQQNYTLESLKGIHGEKTIIIKTPSGGFHVYQGMDERTKDWKQKIGIDGFLDIKTHGGYVVGPGSSIDGKKYELLHDCSELGPVSEELFESIDGYQKKTAARCDDFDRDEIEQLLEVTGFTNIKWKTNGWEFDCAQRGRGTTCPLCDQTHVNNHFYVSPTELGGVIVKNFSNKCVYKSVKETPFLFTDEEKQLINNENYDENYIAMKRKFEDNGCFIEEKACYAITNADGGVTVINLKALRERFLDWNYGTESKSFVETWVRDRHKRRYLNIDFVPENCPATTFNLWKGYEVENIVSNGTGTINPFLSLVDQLCDSDTDYFTKWLAHLFQHPGAKPYTSPVFTSVQGTGKNTLFELISLMMGNNLYYETADADNHLFGRFSTALEKVKCLFVDEMEGGSGFKNSAKLKALITNEHHTIERKGLDAYSVKNFAGVVFASNNPTPVKIEGSDRRFVVYNPRKVLDQKFFTMFRSWMKDHQNQRAVYDYLMGTDLTNIDWIMDRPVSSAYAEMKYNALPSAIKWLDDLIVEDFPKTWVGRQVDGSAVYSSYVAFGHTLVKNQKAFGLFIKTLVDKEGLVGIEKTRGNSGMKYTFDRPVIFDWLKEKGYTRADGLEVPTEFDETGDY